MEYCIFLHGATARGKRPEPAPWGVYKSCSFNRQTDGRAHPRYLPGETATAGSALATDSGARRSAESIRRKLCGLRAQDLIEQRSIAATASGEKG